MVVALIRFHVTTFGLKLVHRYYFDNVRKEGPICSINSFLIKFAFLTSPIYVGQFGQLSVY
jgi:hypothetical protein